MDNFESILNNSTKNRKDRLLFFVPDNLLNIFESYITKHVKTVLIPDGDHFINNLPNLITKYPDISFTIGFEDTGMLEAKKWVKSLNAKFIQTSVPLVTSGKYDLVISMLSFGVRGDYRAKGYSSDELCVAQIEEYLKYLSKNGKLIALAPNGITFNHYAKDFRENILKNFNLKTVSLMPNRLLTPASIVQTILLEIELGKTELVKFEEYNYKCEKLVLTKEISINPTGINNQGDWQVQKYLIMQNETIRKFATSSCKKMRLDEICQHLDKGKSDIKFCESGGNSKVINIADVKDGKVNLNNLRSIELDKKKSARYELHSGDILLTARGTEIRTAIFNKSDNQTYIGAAGIIIIRVEDKIMREYLQMFFESELGQKILDSLKKGQAIVSITVADIKEVEIPILPKEKMEKLVEKYKKAELELDKAKEKASQIIATGKKTMQNVYENFMTEVIDSK